ncbi:hypothetical protein ACJX0J_015642, partial [Zea mays]
RLWLPGHQSHVMGNWKRQTFPIHIVRCLLVLHSPLHDVAWGDIRYSILNLVEGPSMYFHMIGLDIGISPMVLTSASTPLAILSIWFSEKKKSQIVDTKTNLLRFDSTDYATKRARLPHVIIKQDIHIDAQSDTLIYVVCTASTHVLILPLDFFSVHDAVSF